MKIIKVYKGLATKTFSSTFTQMLFRKPIFLTERRGFDLKSNFHIIFKVYKAKIKLEASLGKNPHNYEEIRNETCAYEQKPVKIDDFNEVEEKKLKRELKKENKKEERSLKITSSLRKWKNRGQSKKEKEMIKRLDEFNQEFREIKNFNKNSRKMSKSILKV